jgi:hypothetical protein
MRAAAHPLLVAKFVLLFSAALLACYAAPIQWRGIEGPQTFSIDFGNTFIETCVAAGVTAWTGVNGTSFQRVSGAANITFTWEAGGGSADWAHATVTDRDSQGRVESATIDFDPLFGTIDTDCTRIQRLVLHEMGHVFGLGHVNSSVPPSQSFMRTGISWADLGNFPSAPSLCEYEVAYNALSWDGYDPYPGSPQSGLQGYACSTGGNPGFLDSHGCCVATLFARSPDGITNAKPSGHIEVLVSQSTILVGGSGELSIHPRDLDGLVNRVDWFLNDGYIATTFTWPYSIPYSYAPAGQHKVQAAVYDTAGEYAWSEPIYINVSSTAMAPDTLQPGERLYPNQSRRSPNQAYMLLYQADGNLVLWGPSGVVVQTGPVGTPGFVEMEHSGNLVIRNGAGAVVWQTYTWEVGSGFRVRDNGSVAIISPNHKGNVPTWSAP